MSEWIYGRRTVADHLRILPETCRTIKFAKGAKIPPALVKAAQAAGVPAIPVERGELDRLAKGENHQGVALEVSGWEHAEPETLVARMQMPGVTPVIFALDQVKDPRNLGAVLRVVDGINGAGVVVPKDRSASLTAAAARSAAGAAASIPVARVTNLARQLDDYLDRGYRVVGAGEGGEASLHDAPLYFPLVVVMGSEGEGIRPNVKKRCADIVSIPMVGRISSLNMSVAAGIIAYEAYRRFQKK